MPPLSVVSYLQVTLLVKAPPTRGPKTEEMPKIMPNMLWNMGRLWSGTMGIMIIMAPEKIPADPKPAIARPAMKTGEFGAAPQTALPTSNMTTEVRKTLQSHELENDLKMRIFSVW